MQTESTAAKGMTWDLTSYFPSFDGPEMRDFKRDLQQRLQELQVLGAELGTLTTANQAHWEEALLKAEEFNSRRGHINSYVGNLCACDAGNEDYATENAALALYGAGYAKFEADLLLGLKDATQEAVDQLVARPALAGMQYTIARLRLRSQHTMSEAQEKLAADLGVDGFHAWGRLYDTISGKLEFDMPWPDGMVERLPIAQLRSLMSSSDRRTGRAAFEGGNRAWDSVADICAQAVNSIAGTRLTLNRYRGWDHFLDVALFQSGMTRDTLEAMYSALYQEIEIPRDVFRVKAQFLGQQGISWYEREAPLPLADGAGRLGWDEGSALVLQAFQSAYPALAGYYQECLDHRWIESEVRPGKRPGAYCTGSPHMREQRVYMTYNGTLGDATTLAHEMGHAWHSQLLIDMRPAARRYPMPLAETASIFAEHILATGVHASDRFSATEKLTMLDEELTSAATITLDIMVRYEFEKAMYEERQEGELSVSRLKQLMVDTQRRVFGDSLQPGGEDPLFWASKLHFYITESVFYNYPYTFGFLLARALSNRLRAEGPAFLKQYEDFLRLTGSESVEDVCRITLGIDTTDPLFWAGAIRSLAEPLERFKIELKRLGGPAGTMSREPELAAH